ncbi:MAG: bifunctional helix-turn-helix transcriptional regulator/GNAT family N-acetyltransferase [Pseudomonadota bacterium]
MDFYHQAGLAALGSRLRRLAELLGQQSRGAYPLYGVAIDPRWFPVFYYLAGRPASTISEVAAGIGQTQPAVSQVVRSLEAAGLVARSSEAGDGRKSLLTLTTEGAALVPRLEEQCTDASEALRHLLGDAGADLLNLLSRVEDGLSAEDLLSRMQRERRARRLAGMRLTTFDERYQPAFRQLNLEWIEQHWTPEAADFEALDDPFGKILDPGGYIVMALDGDCPVGTCALIPRVASEREFELAKMCVSERCKGLGVGEQLGRAVIAEAHRRGAMALYLETNRKLVPAIALYRKLGFQEIAAQSSPYQRANVFMRLELTHDDEGRSTIN